MFISMSDPIEHLLEKNTLFGFELPDWLWQDWSDGGLGISKPVIYLFFVCFINFFVFRHIAKNFIEIPNVPEPQKQRKLWHYLIIPLIPLYIVQWLIRLFKPGKGKLQAFLEPVLVFIKDDIVKPNLKTEELSNKFLPIFWSIFFFILCSNLIGLTPLSSTPTGQISVTAGLALVSLLVIISAGMWKFGILGYWNAIVPADVPFIMKPLVLVIEIVSLAARPFAMAIRLLANMTAGHTVLFVITGFAVAMNVFAPLYNLETGVSGGLFLGVPVALVAVLGAAAIMFFELIVALIQAYVFTLLTAIFVGIALHPEH